MLDRLRNWHRAMGPLVLVAILSGFVWLEISSQAPQNQVHAQSANQSASKNNYFYDVWEWLTKDAITVSTLFLAVFTGALVRVSYRQVTYLGKADETARKALEIADKQATIQGLQTDIIEKQKEIMRLEYFATHRPEIVLHSFEPVHNADDRIAVQITYFNKGRAPAVAIEISAKITRLALPLQSGIPLPAIPIKLPEVPSGGRDTVMVESDFAIVPEVVHARLGGHPADPRIFCIGRIIYQDNTGRTRETGFCRVFFADPERWEKTNFEEYEYAY